MKPVNHDYGVYPLELASHSGGSHCKENQRKLCTHKPQRACLLRQEPKTDPRRKRNWDQAASQEGGAWGSRIPHAIASLLGGHSSALGLTFLKSKQSGPRLPWFSTVSWETFWPQGDRYVLLSPCLSRKQQFLPLGVVTRVNLCFGKCLALAWHSLGVQNMTAITARRFGRGRRLVSWLRVNPGCTWHTVGEQ